MIIRSQFYALLPSFTEFSRVVLISTEFCNWFSQILPSFVEFFSERYCGRCDKKEFRRNQITKKKITREKPQANKIWNRNYDTQTPKNKNAVAPVVGWSPRDNGRAFFFSSLGFPICFISFCFSLVASISGIFLFRCPSGAALAACASSTAVAPLQIGLAIALLGFAERDFEKKNGKSTSNSNAIFVKSNSDNANGRNSCRLARVRFCLRL